MPVRLWKTDRDGGKKKKETAPEEIWETNST